MRRARPLSVIALLIAVWALADEATKITIKDYVQRREESAGLEAYQRAVPRLRNVRLGMRTDEFFEIMEMLIIRDKKGQGVDGFLEGHLPKESVEMSSGRSPDHFVVFGWYKDSKKMKGPTKKFYVVFRHNVLREIAFLDPADDVFHIAGKVPE
jgi:hypothetical protein